jgi:glycogen debranching enzyme
VEAFDAALARATDDLRSLYVHVDDARVVSAGIPWYSTIFGRDSIITSIETLPLTPRIAIDTLRYLARRQGRVENAYTEEQPGKILHELRRGEMARSGEIPHVPYYGTIDATPLWIILLHETWRWTGDDALVRSLLPNLRRALEWIDRYGDVDGDGLIEYARTSERGLVNQGWKDSGDGVPYPDGRLPEPPIVSAIFEAATSVELSRLPELYCGMTRGDAPRPVLYPVSCSPQAWASGALFLMLQGVLGIMPDVPRRELHIRNPVLPEFLGELTITGLAVGRSRVALHFVRRASRTLVNLLAVESEDEPIKVRIELD